ncbi:hypothetical protein SALBM135S_06037 [Streptomyces alboniger]
MHLDHAHDHDRPRRALRRRPAARRQPARSRTGRRARGDLQDRHRAALRLSLRDALSLAGVTKHIDTRRRFGSSWPGGCASKVPIMPPGITGPAPARHRGDTDLAP